MNDVVTSAEVGSEFGGNVTEHRTPDEIANNQEVKAVYLGHGDEIAHG